MSDDDRPDPEAFKAMRNQGSGSMKVDDFVGGHDGNTGRKKFEKKWKPKKAEEEDRFGRVDDWVGGSATGTKRSWKVKSPSKASSVPADTDDNQNEAVASPTTRRWKPPPKDEAVPPPWMGSPSSKPKSPSKWTPKSPSMTSPSSTSDTAKPALEDVPPPPHGSPEPASSVQETMATAEEAADDVYKPDPNEFKRMNDQHEAGGAKNDDYVGGSSNTGRTKYEKKWKPQKPDAGDSAARVDDWVGCGSPTGTRRSWKPKSPTKSPGGHHEQSHKQHVVASPTRRWKPPPKEDAVPPPWLVSPSSKPKSPTKWKPKSPSLTSPSKQGNENNAETAATSVPPPPHGSPDPSPKKETTNEEEPYKPDPSEYKRMNDQHEAGGAKNDDFVGSTSNTGRSKFATKKWTPTRPDAGDTAARVDDWAGGTTCTKRGWKVKSASSKPRDEEEEEVEEPRTEPVPVPKPDTPPPSEPAEPEHDAADMNTKDKEEAEGEPTPSPTVSDAKESEPEESPVAVSDDDDQQDEKNVNDTISPVVQAATEKSGDGSDEQIYDKPDPSHFIQMRNIDEAAGSRVDDYVGGSGSNTGRSKFNKKKWTPTKPDAGDTAARVDDWAGGTTCTKRGWKVKSIK